MKKYLPFFFLLIFACGKQTNIKHSPYSKAPGGAHYKLIVAGDGVTRPKPGDFLKIKLSVDAKDSLLATVNGYIEEDTDTFTFSEQPNELLDLISLMNEGDSVSFILSNGKQGSLSLVQLLTAEQVRKNKVSERLFYAEQKADEEKILKNYLKARKLYLKPDKNNLYYQSLRPGKGKLASSGKSITIHYKASTLDGVEFFSTYDNNQPFEFTLGVPGQVLKGMELGIQKMREGEKARLIVPSELAFGPKGSSSGMVGPFKTLIFEIELLKIN